MRVVVKNAHLNSCGDKISRFYRFRVYIYAVYYESMFGFCVWYALHIDHPFATLVNNLAYVFKTPKFQPHITVSMHLKKNDADAMFLKTLARAKPWFRLVGEPYQTKTEKFYAIQQDCAINGIESLAHFHISYAYRLNEPFTEDEIAHASTFIPRSSIQSKDYFIALMDCRTFMPVHWQQLKREP